MTRDHRRKQQIRAHAARTGRSYADAATTLGGAMRPPTSASELQDGIAGALRVAGWPVEVEHVPQGGGLVLYAGPAMVTLSRAGEPRQYLFVDAPDPDDPEDFDLTAPLKVALSAPPFVDYSERLARVVGIDSVELGVRSPDQLITDIDREVTRARYRDIADTRMDAECAICGDAFSGDDLYFPEVQYGLCPSCVFDGDSPYIDPALLAHMTDELAFHSVAAPAAWSGVQALLCCLGGPALSPLLTREWEELHLLSEPGEHWSNPLAVWIWLPPEEHRPQALARLGCGATLERVGAAIEDAHPGLRDVFRMRDLQTVREVRMENGDDPAGADDDPLQVSQEVLDRFWPAAIAFAVGLLTQHAERPAHRGPWHILESFELAPWIQVLDPALDYFHVESVLRRGISIIRDALAPALADEYSQD
jgi:hypothetical protein